MSTAVSPTAAPAPAVPADAACASCGAALQGPYCHHCGEKRLDHHDYALAHFLEHSVDTVTHFDLKVLKGMGALLVRPGRMTRDVLAGRRVPWPKPLQLFLVVNVLYVFLAHRVGMQVFNTPLRYHYSYWYGSLAERMMRGLAERRGLPMDKLTAEFNHLADTLSKTLIFAFIPLLAGVLAVLLWRQRRYYLEHVVVATHLISQVLLVLLIMIGPVALLFGLAKLLHVELPYNYRDRISSVVLLSMIVGWASPLLRRTYDLGRWWALAAGVAVAGSFMLLLIHVYRCLLFFATYWLL